MQTSRSIRRAIPSLMLTLLMLSACGGGGGGGGDNVPASPGAPGTPADNGSNGTDGKDGIDGKDGVDGTDGANGKDGTNGTNGIVPLTKVTQVSKSDQCPIGGQKVETGLDTNSNGQLDDGTLGQTNEVVETQWVCKTGPGGNPVNWVLAPLSTQATRNTGYLATGSDPTKPVVITLPPTTQLEDGDIVSVTGVSGGWKIAQNSDQEVQVADVIEPGTVWRPAPSAGERHWSSVASSSDGRKLVAVVGAQAHRPDGSKQDALGQIYISADSGVSWTAHSGFDSDPARTSLWTSVASSADGEILLAAESGGAVRMSVNGGKNWDVIPGKATSVALSADGNTVLLLDQGEVHVGTPNGPFGKVPGASFEGIALSGDGRKFAAFDGNGNLHIGTRDDNNSGVWDVVLARTIQGQWASVSLSYDGKTLMAGEDGGLIHIKVDAEDWKTTEPSYLGNVGKKRSWRALSVVSTSTRLTLLAAAWLLEDDGRFREDSLYVSNDGGNTWSTRGADRQLWTAVASSADGTKLVAAGQRGDLGPQETVTEPARIFTSTTGTTPGIDGWISGNAGDTIELVHVGGGVFNVLMRAGELTFH